jgi:hypothetical protein
MDLLTYHHLFVLSLHSEVHVTQYTKHVMWREKTTRASDFPYERKCHQRSSAEIVYVQVSTMIVTGFISITMFDFPCQ